MDGSIPPELKAKLDKWAANAAVEDTPPEPKNDDSIQKIVKELQSLVTSFETASMLLSKSDGQSTKNSQVLEQMVGKMQAALEKEPPDTTAPVIKAISRLETALKDTKPPVVEAAQISVAAPNIDLGEISTALKEYLPAAFLRAIQSIPAQDFPEADFSPLADRMDSMLAQLKDIDTGVRMKFEPGTIKVTNTDGSRISTGAEVVMNDAGYDGIVINNGQKMYEFELATVGVIGPFDCRGYSFVRVQFTTVGTPTMAAQFTLDNQVNWQSPNSWSTTAQSTNALTSTLTSSTSVINESPVMGKWFRINMTALTGTQKGIVTFYNQAPPLRTLGVSAGQSANWSVVASAAKTSTTTSNGQTTTPNLYTAFGSAVADFAKASAGNVFAFQVDSVDTALVYFQLHNKTSAPVSTNVPLYSFPIGAGTATVPNSKMLGENFFGQGGKQFSTGIAWGISTTNATYTAAATAGNYNVHIHHL